MIPGLPENHTIAQAAGAAYGEEITVPTLLSGHTLLAIIASKPGESVQGLDVSAFTVGDGTLTSETEDTEGFQLTIIWAQ